MIPVKALNILLSSILSTLHNTDFRTYMKIVIETMTLHMNEIEFEKKQEKNNYWLQESQNILWCLRMFDAMEYGLI